MFASSSENPDSGVEGNPEGMNKPEHESQDTSVRFRFPGQALEKVLTYEFASGMRIESGLYRPQPDFEDFRNFTGANFRKDPAGSSVESPSWRLTRSPTFFRGVFEPGMKSAHLQGNINHENPPTATLLPPGDNFGVTSKNQPRDLMTASSPMCAGGFRCNEPIGDRPPHAPFLPLFKYCVFCKKNGEDERFCKSHNLKDDNGFVACPMLFKQKCPKCEATGRMAHTLKFCPENRDQTSHKVVITTTIESRPHHVCDQYLPKSVQLSSLSGVHALSFPPPVSCQQNSVKLQEPNISTSVMMKEKKWDQCSPASVHPSGLEGVYKWPSPPLISQQNQVKLERANTWDTSQTFKMKENKCNQYPQTALQGIYGRPPPPVIRHQSSAKLQGPTSTSWNTSQPVKMKYGQYSSTSVSGLQSELSQVAGAKHHHLEYFSSSQDEREEVQPVLANFSSVFGSSRSPQIPSTSSDSPAEFSRVTGCCSAYLDETGQIRTSVTSPRPSSEPSHAAGTKVC